LKVLVVFRDEHLLPFDHLWVAAIHLKVFFLSYDEDLVKLSTCDFVEEEKENIPINGGSDSLDSFGTWTRVGD